MSEQNKALVRRWVEEVWNQGSLAAVDEIIAADYVHHMAPPGLPGGPEGYKQLVTRYRTPFRGFRLTLEELIAEGDRVAGRWTIRGIHEGEFMGVAPTGKEVAFTGMVMARIAGGKVAEEWEGVSALELLRQLGALPAPGQPG